MAGILYTYSVTSIRAAKRNAQLHREADGGQLDMRRESLRRHGMLDQVEGTKGLDLFRDAKAESKREKEYMGQGQAQALGTEEVEEEGRPRTEVERALEEFKGQGNAVRAFKAGRPEG